MKQLNVNSNLRIGIYLQDVNGRTVDPSTVDLSARMYTDGASEILFTAKNGVYTNCKLKNSALIVDIESPTLNAGTLRVDTTLNVADPDFSDGVDTMVDSKPLDIELVSAKTSLSTSQGTKYTALTLTHFVCGDANAAFLLPAGLTEQFVKDIIAKDLSDANIASKIASAGFIKNDLATVTKQTLLNKGLASSDLSNVDAIANAEDGSMFYKKNGTLAKAPVTVDDAAKKLKSKYSLEVPPNSVYFGRNTAMHENGGFLEYTTTSLGKNYLLLMYENDPLTGTKTPIYYKRGALESKVAIQPDFSKTVANISEISIGNPTFDRQVDAVYFKLASAVTNLKLMVNINGNDVADYPTGSWDDASAAGFNFAAGEQKLALYPHFSGITDYSVKFKVKADAPISMLGSDTAPYLAYDLHRITRVELVTKDDMAAGAAVKVATEEGAQEYTAVKLLFPFANGLVNDNGIVTINTSFIVTDENDEIVPDCYIIEIPSDSLLSAIQNQGNSNAVTIDFKGINVDGGDSTENIVSKTISFPQALVMKSGDKVVVNTAPTVTADGVVKVGRAEVFEFPKSGGLIAEGIEGTDNVRITLKGFKATTDDIQIIDGVKTVDFPDAGLLIAEEDPADPTKLIVSFGGIPVGKTANGTLRKAIRLLFPQANVFGANGDVHVGTGHSVSQGDDEKSAAINAWVFPDDSGLTAEVDQNNPNLIIVRATAQPGVSITNDDTQPVNSSTVLYFPQARIDDGSTVGSKVVKTAIPIKSGTDNFDDYTEVNFENNDFIVERDGTDNNKINVKAGGISVETNNTETAGIKLIDFDSNDFDLDVSAEHVAKISSKSKTHNGFMAVHTHRQMIASANTQEVYRTTSIKPNSVIWQDEAVGYDPNTGIVTLKYSGSNGEKQLFKVVARATVRRQQREADLGVFLYLANTTDGNYIQDINNETPIVNTTVSKELVSDFIELATMVAITADTSFRIILKDDTPNKFVDVLDLAMGTSAIVVEKVNANNQPSNALINYEILTQQSMRFIKHEFNQSFENAANLIATTPSADTTYPDDTNTQQDGWLIWYQDEGLFHSNTTPDGSANCIHMADKDSGFGYFNIARVLDYEDTWLLRGHEVTAKVDRAEQQGEFVIVPVVWKRRINEYPAKIITSMDNNGNYATTDGWEVVDASKTVIAAPTPAETSGSFTCAYTVPDDAVNIGFMLMPTKQQDHSVIKFTDFAIGCDPTFERWVIEYPEQAVEAQLKKDSKYLKFVQYNTTPYDMSQWYQIPNGTAGDNNFAPLYTGEVQAGGNADITRIYDSSSTDFETLHNKGKFRFGKDGRVQVHYKIPIATDKFADGSDHNTFRIGFVKDTGGGDILQGTPITASLRDIPVPKAGNVFNDSVRTNGYANATFTMDVKENEEYWIALNPINVPRDSGNEGHFYSYPSGMIEFTFLENDFAINQLQSQIAEMQKLLRATSDALTNKAYVELGWDATQTKPTLTAKTES